MKYTKLRLRCRDANNWTIEGYQEPGGIIEKGKLQGEERKGGWDEINPIGYYSQMKHAAKRLLDEELRPLWPGDPEAILDAIAQAEERVLAAVETAEAKRPELRATTQAKPGADMSQDDAERVLKAADPVAVYNRIHGAKRFKRTTDEKGRNLSPADAARERAQAALENPVDSREE